MTSIRAWSEQLDRFIGAIAVQSRADDAYYVDGRDTAQGSGLALWDGEGSHDLILRWRDISGCLRTLTTSRTRAEDSHRTRNELILSVDVRTGHVEGVGPEKTR